MDDFLEEFILDDAGIYGALCEDVVGIVADSVEELEDVEDDLAVTDDEDDIILSMLGVDLYDVEEDDD